jgi:hypothetical protein
LPFAIYLTKFEVVSDAPPSGPIKNWRSTVAVVENEVVAARRGWSEHAIEPQGFYVLPDWLESPCFEVHSAASDQRSRREGPVCGIHADGCGVVCEFLSQSLVE